MGDPPLWQLAVPMRVRRTGAAIAPNLKAALFNPVLGAAKSPRRNGSTCSGTSASFWCRYRSQASRDGSR